MSAEQLKKLEEYTACDVADALLKLEKYSEGQRPLAGFLDGVVPLSPPTSPSKPTIGPAFTVQFQPKDPALSPSSEPRLAESNIPKGVQWSDLVEKDSIVVVQQPEGQKNAAVGGIHALRMKVLGARGLLVGGRVRDKTEMRGLENFEVWSKGTSIVAAGAECKPWATQVPVLVSDVTVKPGDVVFCDPVEGAVRIPQELIEPVLKHLGERSGPEDRIKEEVGGGATVAEAFKKHR